MSKTTNKFSPEVGDRAVRMAIAQDHPSHWATGVSIGEKIVRVPQTLHEWVKRRGSTAASTPASPTEVADKLKALEHKICGLRQANKILSKPVVQNSRDHPSIIHPPDTRLILRQVLFNRRPCLVRQPK